MSTRNVGAVFSVQTYDKDGKLSKNTYKGCGCCANCPDCTCYE